MKKIFLFLLPTKPSSPSPTVRIEDMPVLFHVSNAEASKKVIGRFAELTKEEREGIC